MPFAYHGRFIASLLQQLRKSLLITIECLRVIRKSIGMTMLSREHTGTRRATEWIGNKALLELHSMVSNPVNVRCVDETIVIGTDGLIRMVIAHDINDVHRFLLCLCRNTGTECHCACKVIKNVCLHINELNWLNERWCSTKAYFY